MRQRSGRRALGVLLALGLVLVLPGSSSAAIVWGGSQVPLPRPYSWNYGNAMDFTGSASSFRLTDVFVSDATTPQAAFATSSHDGVSWRKPIRLSTNGVNAENPTTASAGSTLIAGWMTGFSPYDPVGAPRRVQVVVSGDRGMSWGTPKNLSPRGAEVDYPTVAASSTSFGTINLYAVWVDAETGRVLFRSRSGGSPWSPTIRLGATTRKTTAGYSGLANVAASGDLVAIAWVADEEGTVKARAIDLQASGSAAAAATRSEWGPRTVMAEPVALRQHGAPVVAASRLVPDLATIAWNTRTSQVFAIVTDETIAPGVTTIWANGMVGSHTYRGGYGTVVEPAPGGGFVAMWAACRNTALVRDCDVRKPEARVDLLATAMPAGGAFGAPALIAGAGRPRQRINDAPSVVVTGDHVYVQYGGSTSSGSDYGLFARVATGTP
jgi:hypothetical protein